MLKNISPLKEKFVSPRGFLHPPCIQTLAELGAKVQNNGKTSVGHLANCTLMQINQAARNTGSPTRVMELNTLAGQVSLLLVTSVVLTSQIGGLLLV